MLGSGALFLLGACGSEGSGVLAGPAAPRPGTFELTPEESAGLLAYAWNGGPPVPSPGRAGASLVRGELGRTDRTLLYLTFEERDGAAGATSARGAGRFGEGLLVGADTPVSFELGPDPRASDSWTLELWIRLADVRARELLEIPGVLALRVARDGRFEAALQAEPAVSVEAPAELHPGEWNHVGVALDPLTGTLRISANGQPARALLGEATLPAAPRAIVLGPEGPPRSIDELRLRAGAATSAELAEHWAEADSTRPATLALLYADRTEELEVWGEPLADPVIDSEEEWLRGELEHAVVADGELRWAAGHWERILAPDPPPARTTHPTVFVGNHRVLVFGGETRDSDLDGWRNTSDTWLFDAEHGTWEEVRSSLAPPDRCHVGAAYSPDHDLVLLVGGMQNDTRTAVLSDTWVFHVGERRWEQRFPSGDLLGRVAGAGIVYDSPRRRFLLFLHRRVWAYDPEANRWQDLGEPEAFADGERTELFVGGSANTAIAPEKALVLVCGGERLLKKELEFFDTTALYDVAAHRYEVLALDERPSARVRSGFAYDSTRERFVLFGGVQDQMSQRNRDLWSFAPAERRWRRHEASNTPSARGGYYGMAYDPELDRFFLLCGRHSPVRFLNEAWALHLDEHAAGRARFVFDRRSFPSRTAWFLEGETPDDSGASVRFRESADCARWSAWSAEPPVEGALPFVQVEVELAPGKDGALPALRALGFRDPS